jgi:hypothetical protein
VSRNAAEQFVPFARQTAIPFTKIAVEVTVVADNVLAFKELPVALPKERVPRDAVFALREEPVALVKPSEPVNRLVEVTEAKVEEPVTFKSPATLSVPVTEELAATNPPKNWAVVVVKLPRAVTD